MATTPTSTAVISRIPGKSWECISLPLPPRAEGAALSAHGPCPKLKHTPKRGDFGNSGEKEITGQEVKKVEHQKRLLQGEKFKMGQGYNKANVSTC